MPPPSARRDEIVALNLSNPLSPGRGTLVGRTALTRDVVHVPDVEQDPEYTYAAAKRLGGFRAMLGVPMLREDSVVGVVTMWRDEPVAFTDDEIDIVRQFADQAVIAVTTTQLLQTNERQRTELARFLAPEVAALISSPDGEALLAGHRREITVVFTDLRGFTPVQRIGRAGGRHARACANTTGRSATASPRRVARWSGSPVTA